MLKFFKNIFSITKEIQFSEGVFNRKYTCLRFLFFKIKFGVSYINGNNNEIIIKDKNNIIKYRCPKLKNIICKINGNNNRIELTEPLNYRNSSIVITGDNNSVKIGALDKGFVKCKIQLLKKQNNRSLTIGNNFSIRDGSIILCGEGKHIIIGNDVMCSENVHFRTTDSHKVINIGTGNQINPDKNIEIGNHVWIAKDVIISKGSKISDNCIVGTRAFVNKEFTAPNLMIAGTPAKIVKEGVTWE